MPSGGRRFGAPRDRGAGHPAATRPPRPPAGLSPVQREAWTELARQVAQARTYDPTRYSAFRLAALALANVYGAPADLKATSLRSLIETASKLISRFGLDPIGVAQADAAPVEPEPDDLDEFDR